MVVHLLVLLLSCRIQAVGAQVKLSPGTLTVLRGEEARFTCITSSTQWAAMVWMLNSTVVLTISRLHGVVASSTNVTAEKITTSKGDGWVFVLRGTERYNQGQVTCEIQDVDRKTASLFVQEKGSVRVFGDDRLAFKGWSVMFECQAAGWYPQPVLQWQVDGRKVSQGEYNISSEESGKSLFTVSSNLSVTAAKSTRVDCLASVSALPMPLNSAVRLTVVAEVVQERGDCTVPLAVTASLSTFLLLLLLCICTALCYRQRRQAKQNPQEAIWLDQSAVGRSVVAEAIRGKVNLGYSTEGSTDADFSELDTETRSQMDFVSFHKVPDVVRSSSPSQHSESQAQVSMSEESSMHVRRITTV